MCLCMCRDRDRNFVERKRKGLCVKNSRIRVKIVRGSVCRDRDRECVGK